MTVEKLIEQLKQYDPNTEIKLEIEFEEHLYWSACFSTYFSEKVVKGGSEFVILSNHRDLKTIS